MSPRARKFGVASGVIALLLLAAEASTRLFASEETELSLARLRAFLLTGVIEGFEPHPYRVYQRNLASPNSNAQGFSDRAWNLERTPGVPRILCMGGSTTEGGNDKGRIGTYPRLLERVLQQRTGSDFEVMNAGIAGWSTAEMVAAWFLTLQDFRPDVLVLHEAVNDVPPRFLDGFQSDYSHWRVPIGSRPLVGLEAWLARASDFYLYLQTRVEPLELSDVCTRQDAPFEPLIKENRFPPATSLPFRRNILSIAQSARAQGALVVLMTLPARFDEASAHWKPGVDEHNEHLRDLCREHGFLLADADELFAARPELQQEFSDAVHLEPGGNLAKAELVESTLEPWLDGLSSEELQPRQRRRKR